MPKSFTGTLNTNDFYNALFNAYRFMATLADELNGLDTSLANKFKFDGGAYGDKTVVTAMDILHSYEWDPTDGNVLAPGEKVEPKQQEIVVDQKRQISLYTDQYLTKRAWMTPEAFESFNTVVQSEINKTKNVYETRLMNVFIGTTEADKPNGKGAGQSQTVLIGTTDPEDLRVRKVGRKIANLLVELKDPSRKFNDYGHMQAYDKSDLIIIWNADYLNEFNYVDLPVVFHKDGVIDFVGDKLLGSYFGKVLNETSTDPNYYGNYSASTPTTGKPIDSDDGTYVPGTGNANGTLYSLIDQEVTVSGTKYELSAGDELPAGAVVISSSKIVIPCYIGDSSIICKIVHKDGIKFPTGFQTSTEFFNAKNLSTNRYLTWMYGKPQYLADYPFITLREVNS